MQTLLGTGFLNWRRAERVSDRYGTCYLTAEPNSPGLRLPAAEALTGRQGTLVAEVVTPVRSEHIGDLFRGFSPSLPAAGETVLLGEGTLFTEKHSGTNGDYYAVGLRPADGRETDWLNPASLYRVHSSRVRLSFVAKEGPA